MSEQGRVAIPGTEQSLMMMEEQSWGTSGLRNKLKKQVLKVLYKPGLKD